jgi:hypothetical protein
LDQVFDGLKLRLGAIKDLNEINSGGLGTQHPYFSAQVRRFLFLRLGLKNVFPVNAELLVQVFTVQADPLGRPLGADTIYVNEAYRPIFISDTEIRWEKNSQILHPEEVAERSAFDLLKCVQKVQRGEIELPSTW